jgi:hypothetical protein
MRGLIDLPGIHVVRVGAGYGFGNFGYLHSILSTGLSFLNQNRFVAHTTGCPRASRTRSRHRSVSDQLPAIININLIK